MWRCRCTLAFRAVTRRIVTARPPKRPRRPGWPRLTRRIVGKGAALTAMERQQAAAKVLAEGKQQRP